MENEYNPNYLNNNGHDFQTSVISSLQQNLTKQSPMMEETNVMIRQFEAK